MLVSMTLEPIQNRVILLDMYKCGPSHELYRCSISVVQNLGLVCAAAFLLGLRKAAPLSLSICANQWMINSNPKQSTSLKVS